MYCTFILLPPERHFLTQICTQSFVGWGFARDPTGELTAFPLTPELYLGGLLLKRGKGRRGKGNESERKGQEIKRKAGERRGGEDKEGVRPLP